MTQNTNKLSMWTIGAAAVSALAILVGSSLLAPARADEAQAKALLKAMSDYLAAQKAINFDYDSNLEIVSKDNLKVALASSGALTLNRPDKVHATRTGGFSSVEANFDGKTLTMLGKNANAYAQVDAPGTIDQLIDTMRDKLKRPMPAADLLASNPYDELMPDVIEVKDLGSGVIRGQECDHLAFRTKEVDWQIWIAQGDRPYPCRYVITSSSVPGAPQYSIDVRSWKTDAEVPPDSFKLDLASAKKVDPADLPDFDELPAIFAAKSETTGETKGGK
jgi:hypothetical protein